jgi:hypothetical protein
MRALVAFFAFLQLLLLSSVNVPGLRAQDLRSGDVEFLARIQPNGGRLEPVRSLPFYLLRKSLSDIRLEAEQSEPPADLDSFVDGLQLSPELKTWMKKNRTVEPSGSDFTKHLTPADITAIPEFLDAFMAQNGASLDAGVPAPKYKESDRAKNPEKYKHDRQQYLETLKRYISQHPETIQGLDAQLGDSSPTQAWSRVQADQQRKIERRAQILAQNTYLVAQTEADLEGRGVLRAVAPGDYWLSTLSTPAMAGDVRLLWDIPVHVAASQTAHVELNNLNAIEPPPNRSR